ncbi:MAG TPA: hypothetical protein VHD37_01565 [Candidatus Paceibacterota bacterium]|nr:hypothetical protein [Candidatus Paceibacterota bacterium]
MPPEQASQNSFSKLPIIAAVAVVVLLAGWFMYYSFHTQPLVDQTLRGQFVWNVEVVPATAAEATTTVVVLRVAGVDLAAGSYKGDCDEINGKSEPLLQDELSGIICRSGDKGVEIGVFRDGENLVLKRGVITGAEGRGTDFTPITKK